MLPGLTRLTLESYCPADASAAPTLNTYGHLWPDTDERTRAATDNLMSPALDDPADSLRTGRR
jgi:hypothetical protein